MSDQTPPVAYLLSIDDYEYRWFQSVYLTLPEAEAAKAEVERVFPGIKLEILNVPLGLRLNAPEGARLWTEDADYPINWETAGMRDDDYAIAEDGHHIFRWVQKRLEWGDLVWRVSE